MIVFLIWQVPSAIFAETFGSPVIMHNIWALILEKLESPVWIFSDNHICSIG